MSKILFKWKQGKRVIKHVVIAAMTGGILYMDFIGAKIDAHASNMRDAFTITRDMKAGWNLGNSLESENHEEAWGNPRITKEMMDGIRRKGFTTLRIPVRWDDNYSDPYNYIVHEAYMARVQEVVSYALDNDMYVIINVHHNDLQTKVSVNSWDQQQVKDELWAIWTQVGNRFKNYGDKLIFEVNNEPRCGEDWGGNQAYYDCVNEYNETARAAIRATGGNNSRRLVMLPTYCASPDEPKTAGWRKLADDDMIAVSIHAYLPFPFAYEGEHTTWNDYQYGLLRAVFERLYSTFIANGIPVVIGEFGATNMGNTYDREQYAAAYAGLGNEFGIPCIWWDNHCFEYGKENFGIYDRYTYTFAYDTLANNLVNAYGGSVTPPDPVISGNTVILYQGEAGSSNWGQALAIATTRYSGKFDTSYITPNGHFYVEYSGTENELELILQSLSGGAEWAKVPISESGYVNGRYYAKFSYDNCVSAFGTSDFGSLLDKIYVGAKESPLTIYHFSYVGADDGSGNTGDQYVSVFWGESSASNWEQAVSVPTKKNGGSFHGSNIQPNGYFYVEYSGEEGELEFILQSWSNGDKWAKIASYESGYANGRSYAKYSYQDCVSAFGTDNFEGILDKIHVGAKESWITVYSVCYCYPD